jgi:hypothetical protein
MTVDRMSTQVLRARLWGRTVSVPLISAPGGIATGSVTKPPTEAANGKPQPKGKDRLGFRPRGAVVGRAPPINLMEDDNFVRAEIGPLANPNGITDVKRGQHP